ncbi:hypothetical protein [Wenzhouxiangella marina]|uniref:Uncharacterized protein n=1 Tax=Wenzhouxiangella marina TaxID=1579979 RepID=A0A0K0XV96_9GAMM|nr:hypothetical protein [Wenzhouxiangella marina]AKS41590.1 hypothetical protein WM2015_1216 [Wenzhouxiangella marina]MBB6086651.1 hypothetical protein [Wenzhouxiangella marina]
MRQFIAGTTSVCFFFAASMAVSMSAQAQDFTAPASFGSVTLDAGFTPDPHARQLTAGGSIRASDRFTNCRGYIAEAPDYSVRYRAGSMPLIFSVDSSADTTLVINDPNGNWWCDDDGADSPLNPLVRFDDPPSGRYDVWVGTYSAGSGVQATLFVSEIGEYTVETAGANRTTGYTGGSNRITANTGGDNRITANQVGTRLEISLAAIAGDVTLDGGFMPDPWTTWVNAGGNVSISQALPNVSGCTGNTTAAPTVQLRYNGSRNLHIYTDGSVDTVLAINAPDGSWYCNDDGSGLGLDAGISLRGSGVYDIYVGKFSSGSERTQLKISEIALGH